MTDYDKTVNFNAKSETLQEAKAKLEHGELSEELRATLDRIAHGADVAEEKRLTDRLETLRESRRELRQERENIERQLEETNRNIERVERRLEQLREQNGEYDGVLAMLEEDLQSGVRILSGSPKVERAASIGDCTPSDVIQDLRDRNPDTPQIAFRKATADEKPNWKDEHAGSDSVELQSVSTEGDN